MKGVTGTPPFIDLNTAWRLKDGSSLPRLYSWKLPTEELMIGFQSNPGYS
jgi:hypothetical protein